MFKFITRPIIAAGLTLGVFLLMRYLIQPTDEVPTVEPSGPVIEIARRPRTEKSKPRTRATPRQPQQQELPPLPPIVPKPTTLAANTTVGFAIPKMDNGGLKNTLTVSSDRRATPIVRIPPQYPARALTDATEGWVAVEFTITLAGTVEDIVVVDADPERIFDNAVIRAMQRWKYQPKVVNGKPVAQYNMNELFTFHIEQ